MAVEDALLVPTLFDADQKPLAQIAAESRELAERARSRKLTPEELTSSTFTVSNLGMYGVHSFTAIVDPPQAAILAVGGIDARRRDARDAQRRPPRRLRRRRRGVPRAPQVLLEQPAALVL